MSTPWLEIFEIAIFILFLEILYWEVADIPIPGEHT